MISSTKKSRNSVEAAEDRKVLHDLSPSGRQAYYETMRERAAATIY